MLNIDLDIECAIGLNFFSFSADARKDKITPWMLERIQSNGEQIMEMFVD